MKQRKQRRSHLPICKMEIGIERNTNVAAVDESYSACFWHLGYFRFLLFK